MEKLKRKVQSIDWGFVALCAMWAGMGLMLWLKFWRII